MPRGQVSVRCHELGDPNPIAGANRLRDQSSRRQVTQESDLVQPLGLPGALLDLGLAVPGQVAELAERLEGTNEGRTKPCSTSWQIHAASATSFLRTGTLRRCRALSRWHSTATSTT